MSAAATALSYLQRASLRVQRLARRVGLRMRIAELDCCIACIASTVYEMCPTDKAEPLTPEDRDEMLDLMRYGKQLVALRAEAAADLHLLDLQIAASRREVRR